ncbi:O-antigen ligase like membrane protein [Desulfurella multipotens]|uniref:O-antigen ligase like membrane protein n=4 Tax=Desulfurella TaxID=33001 RepID=A0A1G6QW01_9BACT|nr:O-antigen ligase family protein [Desulfurella multipotens]SDC95846.1 O-antigen ligase like membrane protein [Desulfurella multipotens]
MNIDTKKLSFQLLYISSLMFAVFVATSIAADSLAISIGLIGLIMLILTKQFRFERNDLPPALFSITYFWSSVFSINPIHSLSSFHYIWHFAPYWIVSRIKNNYKTIINVLAIFIIISSIGVYFNAFFCIKPANIFSVAWSSLHFSLPNKACAPEGFSGFPSYIGAIMLVSTFFFGALGFYNKKKVYLLASLCALIATILTQERQDWLGLLVGIISIAFFVKNRKIWLIYLAGIVLVVGLAQTGFVKNRLHYTLHFTKDPDIVIRFAMIKASFDIFNKSSLTRKLTGYGPSFASKIVHDDTVKIYKQLANKYHINPNANIATVIDNYYVNILMSAGLIGLILILSAFFMLLRNNIKAIKYSSGEQKAILIGMSLGLIAFYVASGFDNLLGSAQVSIFLSFMLGINSLVISSCHYDRHSEVT